MNRSNTLVTTLIWTIFVLVALMAITGHTRAAASPGLRGPSNYGAQPLTNSDIPNDGSWVWVKTTDSLPAPTGTYDTPWSINNFYGYGWSVGSGTSSASANVSDGKATATASGNGSCSWGINTLSWTVGGNVSDSFNVQWTREWVDPDGNNDPPTKSTATASASGSGTMNISTSAGANLGSTGSASASMSTSGSDPSGVLASISSKNISCDATYDSASSQLGVGGNIAGAVKDANPGVNASGSFSANQQFTANGIGSATGSASYSITSGSWSDNTDTPVTVTETGAVGATVGGGGEDPGSADVQASATINFSDKPAGAN